MSGNDNAFRQLKNEENGMELSQDKAGRVLSLFDRLQKGGVINKKQVASEFRVSEKTIQRDIEDLRAYCY